jgi:hypothetical protein
MPGPSGLEVLKCLTFAFIPKPFDLNYLNHMAALATGA